MAEGFAKAYGADVLKTMSAGLYPAGSVARLTRDVMSQKDIDIGEQYPKGVGDVPWNDFDVIVNMSGQMPHLDTNARLLHWDVTDPIGGDRSHFENVADRIEQLVRELISEIRENPPKVRGAREPRKSPFGLFG